MSVAWLSPAALWGAVLIGLPIVIHLLARHQARTQLFPSLRFLEPTQLAALRRRRVEDVALLLCRMAMIVLAAAALAGPVLRAPWREATYASRVSRAGVPIGEVASERLDALSKDVFRSERLRRAVLVDALRDAVRWLDGQPPSAREIVLVGALRRGDVSASDLTVIPPGIGLRFVAVPAASSQDVTVPILATRAGALVRVDRMAHLTSDATSVSEGVVRQVRPDLVRVAASDQVLADAALATALDAGVPWRDFDTPVMLVWGAAPVPAHSDQVRVVRMPAPVSAALAADDTRRALSGVSPPQFVDVVPINADQLEQWTRPSALSPSSSPLADEGDRRVLWAGVLLLIAVEWWLRRRRVPAGDISKEARVA